jgi:hypothetical protein
MSSEFLLFERLIWCISIKQDVYKFDRVLLCINFFAQMENHYVY